HTAIDARDKKKTSGYGQRVAAREEKNGGSFRSMLEEGRRIPKVVTGLCTLAFFGAVIACMCVDAKRGTWHGTALLLAALVLFAIGVAVVMKTARSYSLVEEEYDTGLVTNSADRILSARGDQRVVGSIFGEDREEVGRAGVPSTFVSSIGGASPITPTDAAVCCAGS
ncbi:MAG: major surface protein MSP1a, partial [Anaplasma ovis]